jgi:hypothetical protein
MRRVVWITLAGALLLAGCAGTEPGGGAPPPPPSPPAATSSPVPAPTPGGRSITVDGVVERGVEPGCLVLRSGAQNYLLQGPGSASAPIEVPVRVTGEVLTGQMSFCQQGTPLRVSSIARR